jgi:hypothetical protein
MARKKTATKKRETKKKESVIIPQTETKEESKEIKLLLENTTQLQKVVVNLSEKINNLTIQLSQLLKLFETSAETLVRKDFKIENESNQEIIKKLDNLGEQNKLLARGLTLMHERTNDLTSPQQISQIQQPMAMQPNINPPQFQRPPQSFSPRPMNETQAIKQAIQRPENEQYQQSILTPQEKETTNSENGSNQEFTR